MFAFTTLDSAAFLSGLGTDTEITYTDGNYATIGNVITDLQYLGITQIRDGISDGAGGSAPLSSYISVAQAGIAFTFLISSNDQNNADILAQLSAFDQVEAAAPGSIFSIEGPNEINNNPVTFDGTTGLAGALAMQAALYADVAADPHLKGVAVDYFTGYAAGTIGLGPSIPAAGMADYDNQHPYPAAGEPPAAYISRSQALPNAASASAPAVYTEIGYSTAQTNDYTQAVYTLDLLLDTAQQGITKTYLYQLLDGYAPGSPQGDSGFGLFDYTGAPKLAATALHDLTSIIGNVGAGAGLSSAISFSVDGLPTSGQALELTAGANDLIALWAEPEIWDATTATNLTAPTEDVTLTLPDSYPTLALFDPLSGTSAIELFYNTNTVTIALTDHPLLLEVPNAALCFCRGTRIHTIKGRVPVEELRIGDWVNTAFTGPQRIRWIGRRSYQGRFIANNHLALPVRIRRHALGLNIPSRDLHVSPGHAICEGGVLVQAWRLVNGVSITQAARVDDVEYFHIELERHAVIFAENTPVESFLDNGHRRQFQNAHTAPAMPPQSSCLPLIEEGHYLARLKARIDDRAGMIPPKEGGALRGEVYRDGLLVWGWAQDEAAREMPVELELVFGGQVAGRVLANKFRADLRAAGIGSGCHAFELLLPPYAGGVMVRRRFDGAQLGMAAMKAA